MASVLLGVCDSSGLVGSAATSWDVNKLGGTPDWMCDAPADLPKCLLCGHDTTFICQIYCPSDGSRYHRTLYIFACCAKSCWGGSESWFVLRSQLNSIKKVTTVKINSAFEDFGVDSFDWGTSESIVSDSWTSDGCGDAVASRNFSASDLICNNASLAPPDPILSRVDELGFEIDSPSEYETPPKTTFEAGKTMCSEMAESICDVTSDFTRISVADDKNYSNATYPDCDLDSSDLGSGLNEYPSDKLNVDSKDNVLEVSKDQLDVIRSSFLRDMVVVEDVVQNTAKREILLEVPSSEYKIVSFISCYIDVLNEEEFNVEDFHHEERLLKDYMQKEKISYADLEEMISEDEDDQLGRSKKNSKRSRKSTAEKFQEFKLEGISDEYDNFMEVVRKCPQQIIRYSHSGTELFIQAPTKLEIPRCSCGSARIFELQLMPGMLNFLRVRGGSPDPAIEFGCVFIYTCSSSCWLDASDRYKPEFVFVQDDESLDSYFNRKSTSKLSVGKFKILNQ